MNCADRRARLRAVFEGDACLYPASVYDPLSARAAESLGFETGMFAGSIASFTVLGAPDLILLTLSEFAAQAQRICRAGELPLIVDADHGYGNALNVRRCVEELETAGVACLTIEDTLLPKRFGGSGSEFLAVDEGVGKMKAALDARQQRELVILGRTGAVPHEGVAAGIERARAYLDAGVDGIMFVGIKARADLDAIAAEIDAPIMLGGAGPDLRDPGYLAERGVRICLQGHQPFMAGVQAMYDTLRSLRNGVPPAELTGVADAQTMAELTRDADYRRWIDEYLS